MMHYINRQIIAGFIGGDPVLRYMSNGHAVLDLRVATARSWKKRDDGEWETHTEWHNCIFYREDAEQAAKIYSKGAGIYIEGRTHTREWVAKDNSKRIRKEIIVEAHNKIDAAAMKTERDGPAPDTADSHDEVPPADGDGFVM